MNLLDVLGYTLFPFLIGWQLDILFGDPARMPHPVVFFGKLIARREKCLNQGSHRKAKGAIMAISLILLTFVVSSWVVLNLLLTWGAVGSILFIVLQIYFIFSCLAGTTLIREVKAVFMALDSSLEAGRKQVSRIVGRDTDDLTAQEVRTAALETLAENLSDGVIAPLFWYYLLGIPGILTYKMINTLDSMIGYHCERYLQFGCVAARIDDVVNYIPARLTALLMVIAACLIRPRQAHFIPLMKFVARYGKNHASPNSGYPEAALAGILNCRFGGPHYYFGEYFPKPYIGENERELTTADVQIAVRINRMAEMLMVFGWIGVVLLLTLC